MAERKTRQAIRIGGNSITFIIPVKYARELDIKPGTNLVIELVGKTLVVSNMDAILDSQTTKTEGKRKTA